MGMIDILVALTIVISVLFALYRGLLRELLGITSWILAGFGALYSYHPLFQFLTGKVENVKIWSLSMTIIIALIILIGMTLLNAHITGKLRKSSLSGLDRILGTAFGILRATLLIVLVWLFASQMALSKEQIKHLKQNNFSVPYIQHLAEATEKIMPRHLMEEMAPRELPKVKIKKPEVEYKEADRKALEEMMEDIVEIEES